MYSCIYRSLATKTILHVLFYAEMAWIHTEIPSMQLSWKIIMLSLTQKNIEYI